MIHGEHGPDERIGQWTRDLLEKPHPTFGTGDFTIVEEQASGKIVSSLNLISQTWSYAGIPFKVGRPELVGTLPEFAEVSLGAGKTENFREHPYQRYRHRVMRKTTYLNEKLGGPACVGCGRCALSCLPDIAGPVQIVERIMER